MDYLNLLLSIFILFFLFRINSQVKELKILADVLKSEEGDNRDDDVLFEEAKKIVLKENEASATLLQRRLQIGYARSARLLDLLEEAGIVGPAEGSKARDVLKK